MVDDDALPTGKTILAVASSPAGTARLERLASTFEHVRVMSVTLADAPTRLMENAAPTAVLLDTGDLPPDGIAQVSALMQACKADRLHAIVSLTLDQLDEIGGLLIADDVVLLCDAVDEEIGTALALAIADSGVTVRDSGAEARQQRIQEEVARFAATLTRIVDRAESVTAVPVGDPFVAEQSRGFGGGDDRTIDPADLRRAIRARRMRDDAFGIAGMFEDPAWDMLLDLCAAELERRQVSVSSLCIAAAVAPTTALRWIGKLIDAGLLERRPDAFDRRRAFMSLTARASLAMRNYVGMVQRAGLAIA